MDWYSQQLKHPKWQRKRLEILERDDFTCRWCGDKETELHIHHSEYKGMPWEVDSEHLRTICKDCHLFVHFLNTKNLSFKFIKHMNELSDCLSMILVAQKGFVVGRIVDNKCIEEFAISNEILEVIWKRSQELKKNNND